MTMNDSRSLPLSLDAQKLKTTIKVTIAVNRKTSDVDESTTRLAGIGSAWGTGPAVLNR